MVTDRYEARVPTDRSIAVRTHSRGRARACRVATTCLLFVLADLYPQYTLVFQGLVALDIISHWMHMYRYAHAHAHAHAHARPPSHPATA
jgi:hypothetical protein